MTQPWHVPRGEAEGAAWEACNVYLPITETFFLGLSSPCWIFAWRKPNGLQCFCTNTPVCLSLGQGSPALQPRDWVSTPSKSFGAKYRGSSAAGRVGESSWSQGEEGKRGMGHLSENFLREEGVFLKEPRKEALLCGCQKAQGGCCMCLNSRAKHIERCCPSHDPNGDRQTERCLRACNHSPLCSTLLLELVRVFNDCHRTMLPGLNFPFLRKRCCG